MQKYLCYSLDHHLSRSKSVFPLVRKTEEWIQRQAASQFWPSWGLRLDACCSGPGLPVSVIPDSACGWDTATVQTNETWRNPHGVEDRRPQLRNCQARSLKFVVSEYPSAYLMKSLPITLCVCERQRVAFFFFFFKVWSKLEIGDHPWDLGW